MFIPSISKMRKFILITTKSFASLIYMPSHHWASFFSLWYKDEIRWVRPQLMPSSGWQTFMLQWLQFIFISAFIT